MLANLGGSVSRAQKEGLNWERHKGDFFPLSQEKSGRVWVTLLRNLES